jgi:uncharacterized protein (DUF2384 family)
MKATVKPGLPAKRAVKPLVAAVDKDLRDYRVAGEVRIGKGLKSVKGKSLTKFYRSEFATKVAKATVMERVAYEVEGVPAVMARDLFKSMRLPPTALHELVGMPRSTLHRRLATPNGIIDGMPGQTVVGYADLLNVLEAHLAEYADEDAATTAEFDAGRWLGEWLREPNPALGGALPADLMHAPSGRLAVTRALGAAFSGAYQ